MSVRDYLNKGIYIDDVEVLSGALPEAAPTLTTDGYSTVVPSGSGINIVVPFVAVWCDLDGGASPTAVLNLWGYIDPPTAGSELNSDWQLIDTVTVSDSVGLTPTLALIPVLGLTRFAVSVQSFTGGATGIGYRLVGISPHAAQAIISMGAAAGVSSNVNLIEIGGSTVVTGGVPGSLGVGGNVAHGVTDAGNPVKTGFQAVAALPTPVLHGQRVNGIADLLGRQMLANFDLINQAGRSVRTNSNYAQKRNTTVVNIVNGVSSNGVGTTYDYYVSPQAYGKFALHFILDGGVSGGADTGITLTIGGTLQNDGTAKESCLYFDYSTTYLSATSYIQANGTNGEVFINDSGGSGQVLMWLRLRLVVSANTGTADWKIFEGARYI